MSEELWQILLIEDDEEDYELTRDVLEAMREKGRRYRLQWAKTYDEGLRMALEDGCHVALVDYRLGANNGVALIEAALQAGSPCAFVLFTGHGSYQIDMQAMQAGADDYLNKAEISPALLERSIRYAISHKRSTASLAEANRKIKASEERFRLALSNSPVTVATFDLELRPTWVYNPRLVRGSEDHVPLTDERFLPTEAGESLTALQRLVLQSEQSMSSEISVTTPGGQRTYLVTLEPMRDAYGILCGMTAAALDVTEQRVMERQRLLAAWQMEAQRHLLDQREMERQQIARDLHDGPIQEVVGLLFTLQMARSLTDPHELDEVLEEMNQAMQKLTANLRGVCNELRPPLLVRFGLPRAIRAHADEFASRHKDTAITLDLVDELPALDESVQLALYRIFQESLNNIQRHAQASQVTVRLHVLRDQVQMEVQDDGQGFRSPTDWVELAREGHLGLVGMRERAEAINGHFEVFSRPGHGTRIRVTAPLALISHSAVQEG